MDLNYQDMRTFADSWALLAMVIFFVGVVVYVMRPGGKKSSQDAANIPFKEDK